MSRKKRAPKPWRKLYTQESADFSQLPLYTRGLAAMLLKRAEDDGFLVSDGEDMVERLARRLEASRGDRRRLPDDVGALLKDGYLVVRDGGLYIRNMAVFQSNSEDMPGSEETPKPRAKRTRVSRVSDDSLSTDSRVSSEYLSTDSRVSPDCLTSNNDPSARNHSGDVPPRTRAHSEREREREKGEGEAPPPSPPDAPAEPPEPPASGLVAKPVSQPAANASAGPYLTVLRSHPELAGVANPAVAERVEQNGRGKYKLEDFAQGCADIVRNMKTDADIGRFWDDVRINKALEPFAKTAFDDRISGKAKARTGQAVPVFTAPAPPLSPDVQNRPPPTPEERKVWQESARRATEKRAAEPTGPVSRPGSRQGVAP